MTVAEHTLYVVATPIGHRDDLSMRAIETLQSVDRIYAEDTRHSGPLLKYHRIQTRVYSLHEHNETGRVKQILGALAEGASVALICDAGTPLISDPGYRLVRACLEAGCAVSPIPGASALLAALSVGGQATDHFEFAGFAPSRAQARQQWLKPLLALSHTLVLYESPHRIVNLLQDISLLAGPERDITLARELTKRFETLLVGTAGQVLERVQADADQQRGEFVVLVAAAPPVDQGDQRSLEVDAVLTTLLKHVPASAAARIAADLFGMKKQVLYQRVLSLQAGRDPAS